MTRSYSTQRAATAAALALFFALTQPIIAGESPKTQTPATPAKQERESQDAMNEKRADCKKIYQRVRQGHPGKGTDVLKLVRVECPTQRG